MDANGLGFFQRNNPVVRHVVLRRRETLEEEGLMPRIAVDVHPMKGQTLPTMFAGLGLQTSADFDVAYEAAENFTKAFGKRKKSAGLLKNLVRQRLCSSVAAGLATARKLLEGRQVEAGEQDIRRTTAARSTSGMSSTRSAGISRPSSIASGPSRATRSWMRSCSISSTAAGSTSAASSSASSTTRRVGSANA